jgi:hypothetical protein
MDQPPAQYITVRLGVPETDRLMGPSAMKKKERRARLLPLGMLLDFAIQTIERRTGDIVIFSWVGGVNDVNALLLQHELDAPAVNGTGQVGQARGCFVACHAEQFTFLRKCS